MATEQLRLVDGTIVRKCPTIKPLYCSRAGKFYSVHNAILTDDGWVLREIKPVLKQSGTRRCTFTNGTGTHYHFMRNFQNKHCHFLVAAADYTGFDETDMESDTSVTEEVLSMKMKYQIRV